MFCEFAQLPPKIPSNATLVFDVNLLSFDCKAAVAHPCLSCDSWAQAAMEISLARDIIAFCLSQTQERAAEELQRRRRGERCAELLDQVLRRQQVAHEVGRFAGLEMSSRLCALSRFHGANLRSSLALLRQDARPELYVFGGQTSRQTLASVERFDWDSSTWESLPPMPTARSFCCAAVLGGKLFVFGGERDQRAAFAAAECFDPVSGDWERLPPLPTPRAGCCAAAAAKRLMVCGGLVMAWQVLDVAEGYDPDTRKWQRYPPMPTPRCGCAAAGFADWVLVCGGQLADGTVLDKVEMLSVPTESWECLAALPSARSGCSAAVVAGTLLVVGGLGGSGLTIPVVDRFDLEAREWTSPLSVTLARAGAALCVVGHTIHLLGGFDGNRQDCDHHDALDLRTSTVCALRPLPAPRRLCCGAAVDNLFGDWACMRTVIREGEGWGCLMEDCEVEISIRAEAEDGRTLEELRQVPYNLGSGNPQVFFHCMMFVKASGSNVRVLLARSALPTLAQTAATSFCED
ncbi:Kelch-like protein 4 [Symbiodinium microadriaticum]|uniref:Kelch-like protein 4 n=1 Tax=Symbiodinium microadriaticum TaxID=2951 RepID=A0A1Q9C4T5_SYMMI|nr:Kelch-like protein 4 [Symbiodinium microadriaticum]